MEEKIYKIILGDGTEISNLKLNGNNFISTEKSRNLYLQITALRLLSATEQPRLFIRTWSWFRSLSRFLANTGLSLEIFLRRSLPEPKCSLTSPTLR